MTTDDGRLRKFALCSGIAAGIAYLGYSFIKSALCEVGWRSEQAKSPTLKSESCQTDVSLPLTSQPVPLPGTSVRDRIRELNLRAREFKEAGFNFSVKNKAKSLQNTPWSSPRIQSPADGKQAMSRSVESLSSSVDGNSPYHQRKSMPKTGIAREFSSGFPQDNEETLLVEQDGSCNPLLREPEKVLLKQLESLYSKARIMTPYEAKSLVTLLYSDDDEVLVKVLTTISNCAAFTVNQDHFADTGCFLILRDLIVSPIPPVQVSSVQAISNLAVNSQNQALLQPCVPVLLRYATDPEAGAYLRALSLTALANLALEEVTVTPYKGKLHSLFELLEEGNTIKIQALKLLNNLSCSPDMIPFLLASKCPPLSDMLDINKNGRDVTLRLLTFLENVTALAAKQSLRVQDLPVDDKAPSPETFYSTIFGHLGKDAISKKMVTLSATGDEEISTHAQKLYEMLSYFHL
ncbi:uncharacterized protein LOC143236866 [Tachypleus tridentatus]|uniref:uncharacterized protein LOC143236866 n=1 Tax=Tachypleus tridentatus TaxID=6853 RepID=UPI003FD21C79